MRGPLAATFAIAGVLVAATVLAQNESSLDPGQTGQFSSGTFSGPVVSADVISAAGFDGGWGRFSSANVSGQTTSGGAVSAPLFDGGSAVLTGTLGVGGQATFGNSASAPLFDGGSAVLTGTLNVSGFSTFGGTVSAPVFDGGVGSFSTVTTTGSVMAGGDLTASGAVVSTTANGGFQSSGLTSALLRGFPASGVGVRLNAGTALGGTAGDALAAFENATVQKAVVSTLGRYLQVGGLPAKIGSYFPAETTSTAFTAVGLPSPTLLAGTPTASNADALYQMILFTTGGSSGNASGLAGPFTTTRITHLPRLFTVQRTDASAVTSTYIAFGVVASAIEGLTTLAGANTIRGCWFRFDTGLSDTTWQAVSSDGTTASATDTTITVAAATTYALLVDAQISAGTCRYYVDGVLKVSKATNLPTGSTALGIQQSVVTRTNAARTFVVAHTRLEQM